MRVSINLASRPFEDLKAFYRRWITILGVAAAVTAVLLSLVLIRWTQTRAISQQIAEVRRQMDKLEAERNAAQAMLNRPENRNTRDRSRFVNDLIARKAFSWTQILTDLEAIMPRQASVASIRPQVTAEGALELRMQISATSREPVLELVRRMEGSPRFHNPAVGSEFTQDTEEGLVQFEIAAQYVPPVAQASSGKPVPAAPPGGGH